MFDRKQCPVYLFLLCMPQKSGSLALYNGMLSHGRLVKSSKDIVLGSYSMQDLWFSLAGCELP